MKADMKALVGAELERKQRERVAQISMGAEEAEEKEGEQDSTYSGKRSDE